ncbi:MAG TPA: NAD-dependent epimerase/dehydratase family protein [Tepidisphaeraceae bacterium]|jgi:nucleoside-diphosphate-sugar epimerase|nr:NAD-dependent epimerase/dehydratase family protein [Tepidisphaeraceae bacterium]
MRVFIIGGTRFIGPCIARQLLDANCEIALFHRGQTESPLPQNIQHIHGDLNHLDEYRPQIQSFRPDVILHMRASTRAQAETFMRTVRDIAPRVVVPSSQDVYRAYGRLHKTEPGPIDPTPLTEDSPLREKLSIHGEAYEKKWVEEVVMNDPQTAGTILRYPAVYGPGDYRLYDLTRRMLDNRPAILLEKTFSAWRWTHGYVEDIAHTTTLAILNLKAATRIYNCGESISPTYLQRVQQIARAANWNGKILTFPFDQMPPHLREPLAWEQDWLCDTTRIRTELGFKEKCDYNAGLRAMVQWHRDHPKAIDPKEFDYAAEDAAIAALR